MLTYTDWHDEWIIRHYPEAVFYTDKSGEVYVGLGIDTDEQPFT